MNWLVPVAFVVGVGLACLAVWLWQGRQRTLSDTAADLVRQHKDDVTANAKDTVAAATTEAAGKVVAADSAAKTEIKNATSTLFAYLRSRR